MFDLLVQLSSGCSAQSSGGRPASVRGMPVAGGRPVVCFCHFCYRTCSFCLPIMRLFSCMTDLILASPYCSLSLLVGIFSLSTGGWPGGFMYMPQPPFVEEFSVIC